MSILQNRKKFYSLVCLAVAVPVVCLSFVGIGLARKSDPPSMSCAPLSQEHGQADAQVKALNALYTNRYDGVAEAQLALERNQKGLRYKIPLITRMPKDQALGNPLDVYVLKDKNLKDIIAAPELMSNADVVRVTFRNGMYLTAGFKTDQSWRDYKQLVATSQVQDGGVHTELPKLMSVHGFEGWGCEPGYDYYAAIDEKNLRGAFLEWTDGNAMYSLRAPLRDQSIPLSRLLEIANSMY